MRIWQISDLHLKPEQLAERKPLRAIPDADVAVVIGDLGASAVENLSWCADVIRPKMPVVYVPGNHDFHHSAVLQASARARRHARTLSIHYLDQDTVVVDGVRFVGGTFWSDYAVDIFGDGLDRASNVRRNMAAALKKADYTRIMHCEREKSVLKPWHTAAIHERTKGHVDRALSSRHDGPTVVVTHHCPLPDVVQPGFEGSPTHPSYCSDQTAMIRARRPAMWLHGHIHVAYARMVGDTRVVCNPMGFPKEDPGFDWGLVHRL